MIDLRIGSAAAIVGSIVFFVFNMLHPRFDPNDMEATLRGIAESPIWVPDHLGLLLGALLTVGGLVTLSHSTTGTASAAMGRLSQASALVSGGMFSLEVGIDGVATKWVAEAWAKAPAADKAAALQVGRAIENIDLGMFSVFILVFFGLTFLVYGLTVALSNEYPRWLGWVAVVLSLAAAFVGSSIAVVGPSGPIFGVFAAVSLLLTVWVFVMGVLMWRQPGRTAAAPGR